MIDSKIDSVSEIIYPRLNNSHVRPLSSEGEKEQVKESVVTGAAG